MNDKDNTSMILAIDPGTTQSAWVVYGGSRIMQWDGDKAMGIIDNEELVTNIADDVWPFNEAIHLAIEMVASYGMPVGASVFETCVWIGRFVEAWIGNEIHLPSYEYVYRKDVKMHLCGQTKAKDSNIRQAIMDLYGSTREKAIGTKKDPKALYGVKQDIWAALGVAITAEGRR